MGTSPENALTSFDFDLLLGPTSASISENTELSYNILNTGKFETSDYVYQAQTNRKSETKVYNYPIQNSETRNYDFLDHNAGTSTEYQYQAENLSNGMTTSNGYQIQDTGNEFSLQVDVVSKAEHAALENKFVTLSNNYVSLKNDYDAQMKDYAKVQRQFANLAADYAKIHELNKEHAMECLNVTSKCQELQKQIINYEATIKALQEHCNKLDLDIYAQSRQFVQYQSLVDELQTRNTDLKAEVKTEKINGRDGRKMISALTNNNKTLTEHLCLFACIVEGRKKLDKESRLLIKKYCKTKNRKNTDLDFIENQSVDTGRASSLASSDGEPSFLSPAYSFNFSPFSSNSIIMKQTKDASSSPPPGIKTKNISTSPIIFEERLSVPLIETCEYQTPEDNLCDISPSPIQLNNTAIAKTTVLIDAKKKPMNTTVSIKDKSTPVKSLDITTNVLEIDITAATMANAKTLDTSTGSIEFALSIPVGKTIFDATCLENNDTHLPKHKQPVDKTVTNVSNVEHKNTAVPKSKMPDITNTENNDTKVIDSKNSVAKSIIDITSSEYKETEARKSKNSMNNTISNTSPKHKETEVPTSKIPVKAVTDIISPELMEIEVHKTKEPVAKTITDITSPENIEAEVPKSKIFISNTITDITSPGYEEAELAKTKKSVAKTITDITSPEYIETEAPKPKKSKSITDITNPDYIEAGVPKSKTSKSNTITDITSPGYKEAELAKTKKSVSKTITDIVSAENNDRRRKYKSKKIRNKSLEQVDTKELVELKTLNLTDPIQFAYTKSKDVSKTRPVKQYKASLSSDKSSSMASRMEGAHTETRVTRSKTELTSSNNQDNASTRITRSKSTITSPIEHLISTTRHTRSNRKISSLINHVNSSPITKSKSVISNPVKDLDSKNRRATLKKDIFGFCEPTDVKLVPKPKILDISNPMERSEELILATPTGTSTVSPSKGVAIKHKLNDTSPIAHIDDSVRLTRSRSNTLNITPSPTIRKTRSKTGITNSVVCSDSDPQTPVKKSIIGFTSPIKSLNTETPASTTNITSPIRHEETRRSLFKEPSYSKATESDSEIEISLDRKTTVSKKAQRRTRRITRSNSSNISLTESNDRSTLISTFKSGITSPLKLDFKFKTGGTKSNMAKAKKRVTNESCDKRTSFVQQKMNSSSPVVHSDSIRVTRSKTSTISPVKIAAMTLSKSDSLTAKTNPIECVSLRSHAPKSETEITSLIELERRPSISEFEKNVAKTNMTEAKAPNVSIEGFEKTLLLKTVTSPSVMHSDDPISFTKCQTEIMSPVNFTNMLSESNSIKPINFQFRPIQSISSPIELTAKVRDSMSKSKTDYNKSIEIRDTRSRLPNTKEITIDSKPEPNILPKNKVVSHCDTRAIDDNGDNSVPVACKEIAKKLKEIETLQLNNCHNDADNDLEINVILRKYSIDWAMLSPLSLSPVDIVKKQTRTGLKDGTVMEQSKINDELIESLQLSDEDSEDDNNREDDHYSELIVENQQPVAKVADFVKEVVVENNKRNIWFEGDVFEPLDKCPTSKIQGSKYKKLTKLQKIYKANVRKNIQLSPTVKKQNKPYSISPTKLAMIVSNKEKTETSAKILFRKPDAHVEVSKEKINTAAEPKLNVKLSCVQIKSQPECGIKTTECKSRDTSSSIRSSFLRIRTNPLPQCGRKKQVNSDSEFTKPSLNTINENESSAPLESIDNSNISFVIPSRKRISRVTGSYPPDSSDDRDNTKDKSDINHNDFDKEPPPTKKNKVVHAEIETRKSSIPPKKNKDANADVETTKRSIPPENNQDTTTKCRDLEIISSHNNITKDKERQQNISANNVATILNDCNSYPKDHCGNINKTTKEPDTRNVPPKLPPNDHFRHCADYNDINMFTSQNNKPSEKQTAILPDQWTQNILDKMILKYGSNIKSFKKPQYNVSLAKQIEKGIANCVKHSQEADKYSKTVQELVNELKSLGQQRIISGLMTFLNDPVRKKEIPTVNRFQQGVPTVTKTEMVLIDLIESLDNSGLPLWELVLDGAEYILFTLEKGATPVFEVVESVAHFYANACKYLRKTSRLWMFMLNAMYCLSFKAIPLIKHCLDVKPNLLPFANRYIDPGLAPVIRCFVFLLHFYNCDDPFKRVEELRMRLKNKYHFQLQDENETTILFMCKQCISNLPDRKLNKDMLELVLLILAKRRGTKWCHKNIVQKILLPMIKGEIDISYAGKRFCISTIGNIVKPYKHEMTVYSEEVVNLLLNMFETTLSHDIKQDIIRSLINMSMKAITERIDKCLLEWNPSAISPELELVLKDYVQSRQMKNWQYVHRNQLKT